MVYALTQTEICFSIEPLNGKLSSLQGDSSPGVLSKVGAASWPAPDSKCASGAEGLQGGGVGQLGRPACFEMFASNESPDPRRVMTIKLQVFLRARLHKVYNTSATVLRAVQRQ